MSQYAKEIKHILATLNELEDEQNTPLPDEEELDTIHVYPVEGGGLLLTKTPLEPDEAPAPIIDGQDDHDASTAAAKTPPPFVLFLLLLCVFMLGDLADTQLIALMTPTATIANTSDVRTITLQSTATLGKLLSPITLTQSQTVPTTGHGHQDTRRATGTLTFYNGELQTVTVAVGTLFTGRDGEQVSITQEAVIPAADPTTNPPTFGHAAVAAKAVQAGASGNIPDFDLSGSCCAASVIVKNLASFSNGQDERDYLLVTKADRDTAVATLHAKVTASMTAALYGQLLPGQDLHAMPCSPATTANHVPGEEATSVTVTVSETCSAVAYDMEQLNARATRLLTARAPNALGTGYVLFGNVHITVSRATAALTSSGVVLAFTCQGTFAYTLNGQAQQRIKTLIAGKPRRAALRLLLEQTGIHTASINGISDTQALPDDQTHIHLLIVVPLL